MTRHDAKYSDAVANQILNVVERMEGPIVDPFAGTGGFLLTLQLLYSVEVYGIEIEAEWAEASEWVRQGDALDRVNYYPAPRGVITSPCYGNRFSGNYLGPKCRPCKGRGCEHCAQTGHQSDRRYGYAISLGRKLDDRSAAQWDYIEEPKRGMRYKRFHAEWLTLIAKILPDGKNRLLLNMSDHYRTVDSSRGSERQYACNWWIRAAHMAGFRLTEAWPIETPRTADGANRELRAPTEMLFMFDLSRR